MSSFETSWATIFEGGYSSLEARSQGVTGPLKRWGAVVAVARLSHVTYTTGVYSYPQYAQELAELEAVVKEHGLELQIAVLPWPGVGDPTDAYPPPGAIVLNVPSAPISVTMMSDVALAEITERYGGNVPPPNFAIVYQRERAGGDLSAYQFWYGIDPLTDAAAWRARHPEINVVIGSHEANLIDLGVFALHWLHELAELIRREYE